VNRLCFCPSRLVAAAVLSFVPMLLAAPAARGTELAFDLPDAIECRDATPPGFAQSHPGLKVIEGKFRISARVIDGKLADVVDFLYVLKSDNRVLRLQDYLPNTTLESAVVDDQIEISDASENATAKSADAHVVYKPFALGGTLSNSTKNCESSKYKQIAPRELVLAAGTTNREHGVFFRLQPSRSASLEGAKEFTFLATVPGTWRGDLCTITCGARAKKSSLVSTSVVAAGSCEAEVALYLAGDADAAALAEQLRAAQETHAKVLASQRAKEGVFDTISSQTVRLFTGKKSDAERLKELHDAEKSIAQVEHQLRQMAR
jgi:hypothetical protein